MKTKKWFYPVLMIIIGALIIIPGCSSYKVSENNGDKTFLMNRGIARFSFDFNPKYRVTGVVVESTGSDITLRGPELDQYRNSTILSVYVNKTVYKDYQGALETYLSMQERSTDFKLLERSSVTIAEEPGEEVVYYSLQSLTNEALAEGIQPVHQISRHLEFAHNGLIWALGIKSLESSVEEDKLDFEQIKRTFKIVN